MTLLYFLNIMLVFTILQCCLNVCCEICKMVLWKYSTTQRGIPSSTERRSCVTNESLTLDDSRSGRFYQCYRDEVINTGDAACGSKMPMPRSNGVLICLSHISDELKCRVSSQMLFCLPHAKIKNVLIHGESKSAE